MNRLARACSISLLFVLFGLSAHAQGVRIKKVLPFLLDQKGRHTVSPSLFDRDAYQFHLRQNPKLVSALRYDVQWKKSSSIKQQLKLRLELRTQKNDVKHPMILETNLPEKKTRGWAYITIPNQTYLEQGSILAWRASVYDGEKVIAEQKSFLWE